MRGKSFFFFFANISLFAKLCFYPPKFQKKKGMFRTTNAYCSADLGLLGEDKEKGKEEKKYYRKKVFFIN